jgi:hypothetical protein
MGVPMIAWPLYAEQHFNSKFVVDEIQIALEAPQRIDQNWLVTRDGVERIVKVLMVEEKGRELRERVRELKEAARAAVAEGGSSTRISISFCLRNHVSVDITASLVSVISVGASLH